MRCKNCGWPNKPNEKVCVKCHAPLEAEMGDSIDYGKSSGGASQQLNKTVLEDSVFGTGGQNAHQDSSNGVETDSTKICPKCGYPVRSGNDKCPNCKFPVNQQPEARSATPETPAYNRDSEPKRRPTRISGENPVANNNMAAKFKGTINPYMMNLDAEPVFFLKPVKKVNERHELEAREFEGTEIVLNRDNTESNNLSITSRQQAVMTHENGRWYIEDKSEQKTTFVQAASKIELHDGDIILLGNRLFEFHK